MIKAIAFTIKGLEQICAEEIAQLGQINILKVEEKAVFFEINEKKIEALKNLLTVDDVALLVDEIDFKDAKDHNSLATRVTEVHFGKPKRLLSKIRDYKLKTFSLTVSLPSVPNIRTIPFKDLLAKRLAKDKEWVYSPKDHTNFDIRLFRSSESIVVAVKLFENSLFKRPYKEFSKRGSLRPTIASGLVHLAKNLKKGSEGKLTIVDNFCGSGTILAEAYLQNFNVIGGDKDRGSVEFTKKNLSNLDIDTNENINIDDIVKVRDASNTDIKENSIDIAISNLPWGTQVGVKSFTDLFEKSMIEYKRILKEDYVIVLIVKKPELCIKVINDVFSNPKIESFQLSLVGQQPTVLTVIP